MYRLTRSLSFIFGLFDFPPPPDPGPMSIWFSTQTVPGDANSWYQWSLPVGNGKLAAMVYGGINTEQIQFNEDTIWGGQPHDYKNPNATPAPSGITSERLFQLCGRHHHVGSNEQSYLVGTPSYHAGYQTAGVFMLSGFRKTAALRKIPAIVEFEQCHRQRALRLRRRDLQSRRFCECAQQPGHRSAFHRHPAEQRRF